ncbi:hypothetical protein [Pontibacter burrus]|uniref:Uncharacterized protein n=1 Tax=Pontibacter burrus TaxID=2704466 RepID=A0A6B3LWF4_9BACT|nr:hypothetical protein [Pontibacter burrus]NEM97817.1 hypothetical protein [Pontibacter burrus]
MRERDNRNYGSYNDRYRSSDNDNRNERNNFDRRQDYDERGSRYRMEQDQNYRQRGNYQGTQEDYYNQMYDISNYSGAVRDDDYGLPHGSENELMSIKPMPLQEGPYYGRRRYNYNLGYNPNFDNPEEGDMYRDFDSRGNHGYRHDASYGNVDEFRDFGNDHYGSYDRTNRADYEEDDRYDRY